MLSVKSTELSYFGLSLFPRVLVTFWELQLPNEALLSQQSQPFWLVLFPVNDHDLVKNVPFDKEMIIKDIWSSLILQNIRVCTKHIITYSAYTLHSFREGQFSQEGHFFAQGHLRAPLGTFGHLRAPSGTFSWFLIEILLIIFWKSLQKIVVILNLVFCDVLIGLLSMSVVPTLCHVS